jgi:hypothetical protein
VTIYWHGVLWCVPLKKFAMGALNDTELMGGDVEEHSHDYWEWLEVARAPEFFVNVLDMYEKNLEHFWLILECLKALVQCSKEIQ